MRSTRDPETGLFTGDITTLQPGVAYFVTSDARTTVEVTLQSLVGQLPPTIQTCGTATTPSASGPSPVTESVDMDDYLTGITVDRRLLVRPDPGRGWECHPAGWRSTWPWKAEAT